MADADKPRTSADAGGTDQQVRGDQLTRTQEARGYSWPPFERGHTLSMRHGANSERMLSPLVAELLEGLDEHAPWTVMPAFAPLRMLWAHAGAEYLLRFDALDSRGVNDNRKGDGYDRLDRARARFENLSEKLGLGPMALAKLLGAMGAIDGPASSQGLDALKAAGRELREAAERRALSPVQPELDHRDGDEHEREHVLGEDDG